MPHDDCSHWSIAQVNQFFSSWLGTATKQTSSVYIPGKPTINTTAVKTQKLDSIQTKNTPTLLSTTWRKNQPVKHVKYGVGTVQEIEEKTSGETHITVRFKIGLKKIVAQFLQRL
jgi:hypothetical protein